MDTCIHIDCILSDGAYSHLVDSDGNKVIDDNGDYVLTFTVSEHMECELSGVSGLDATLSDIGSMDSSLTMPEIMYVGGDPYTGEYTVTPNTFIQTLDTKGFVMKNDVTVTEIPYAEVSNTYGTTISIVS